MEPGELFEIIEDDRDDQVILSGSEEEEEEEEEEEDKDGMLLGKGTKHRPKMQLYCEICEAHSSSAESLQLHFAGTRHKRKLEMAGLNSNLTDIIERPKNLEIWNKVVKCLLCKVMVMGCDCLIHSKCQDHMAKINSMSKRNQDFYNDISNCFKPVEKDPDAMGSMDDNSFFCEMCRLQLSSKEHLEYHLKGKRHQKKERWGYISDRDSGNNYRQLWCSLCQIFVNNLEELEHHFLGKHHMKMLKRAGVKWKALVDVYGEDVVGMPIVRGADAYSQQQRGRTLSAREPVVIMGRSTSSEYHQQQQQRRRSASLSPDRAPSVRNRHVSEDGRGVERERRRAEEDDMDERRLHLRPRHHSAATTASSSGREDERLNHHRSRSRSPQNHYTTGGGGGSSGTSPSRSRCPSSSSHDNRSHDVIRSSPRDPSPIDDKPFMPLRRPKWTNVYTTLPEYNPRHPKILREGRKKTGGEVIYQFPLLAIGEFAGELGKDDPRFKELEEKTKAVTMVRETREKQMNEMVSAAGRKDQQQRGREPDRKGYSSRGGQRGGRGGGGRNGDWKGSRSTSRGRGGRDSSHHRTERLGRRSDWKHVREDSRTRRYH